MTKYSFLVFTFAVCLSAGGFITYNSWEGTVYVFVDDGESRNPAAVEQNMDFSTLKGSDLSLASQKRILQEAKVVRRDLDVGIELGHFITRRSNGKKSFACHIYKTVELKFVAKGIAESGESPVMHVDANCRIGKSVSTIAPIWIPAQQILAETPGNMELNFTEPYRVSFRFDHIGDSWPKNWDLISVRLVSESKDLSLQISDQEMLDLIENPLTVSWTTEGQETTQ